MKVAFLTERMLLGFGVDLVVHEQARRLQNLGHKVTVFTTKADNSVKRDYDLHVLSEVMPGFYDYTNEAAIQHFLASDRARTQDIWILHTPPFYQWVSELEAPVVFMEHGCPPGHLFDHPTAYHLWKMMHSHYANDYRCLRNGDAILSISRDIHNSLPSFARTYSNILYHGADHYPEAHPGERLRFRYKHGVKEGDVLILWVGRMQFKNDEQPYKGFEVLLDLIPAIKDISKRVKIACLGKIDVKDIQQFDGLDVILLPNLPAEQMGIAYASADILLNLARWEGFNLALVEAQFQGTPVVALDVGPHAEVTDKEQSSLLVDSVEQIVPALTKLVSNKDRLLQMSIHARQVARRFSWDHNARELEKLLVGCANVFSVSPPSYRTKPARAIDLPSVPLVPDNLFDNANQSISDDQINAILAQEDIHFVDHAYWTLLGRLPDEAGRHHYMERLTRGKSRISVLRDIASGPEYKRRGIEIPHKLNKRSWRERLREQIANVTGLSLANHVRQHVTLPVSNPFRRRGNITGGLEQKMNEIEFNLHNISERLQQFQLRIKDDNNNSSKKISPPNPYHTELSSNYICLHAPGVSIENEAYARIEHIAEMSGADIIFCDEWVILENNERVPVLRTAFSQYSFAELPDLGGAIAVRRSLLSDANLEESAALTGAVLMRLIEQAHCIVHQPVLLCQRNLEDVVANYPSDNTQATYLASMGAALEKGDGNGPAKRTIWAKPRGARGLVITPRPNGVIYKDQEPSAGRRNTHNLDNHVTVDADAAAINRAVWMASDEYNYIIVVDYDLQPLSNDWVNRLSSLAMRTDVGMVGGLVLTSDGRITNAGWHTGPHGALRPRARFQPLSRKAAGRASFIDPVNGLHEVSALDLSCAAVKRSLFLDLGGLDEKLNLLEAGLDFTIRLRGLALSLLLDGHVVMVGKDSIIPHSFEIDKNSFRFHEKNGDNLQILDRFSTTNYNGTNLDPEIHGDLINFSYESHRSSFIVPRAIIAKPPEYKEPILKKL